MNEKLIKPYEISVWENKLNQDGNESNFIEKKLAVIGSNTMTGLNKIYNPVFNKKSNGEKTLTFSLKYKYFDPYTENEEVINPFVPLLINERKIKLHYDNEWYEFIIKDHTESSDGYEWTYTCSDAFVLELSKIGYNITFDTELSNNQGTAAELVKETIKDTDWRIGSIEPGKQLIAEPIYKAILKSTDNINIINVNQDSTPVPQSETDIYLFYSYVKNQSGKFIQFILRDENRQYTIDDKNVITDTNFRIITELKYKEVNNVKGFWLNDTCIIEIGEVETYYQANRLAYNQKTAYDPIMERTVDRFKAGDREIYRYVDSIYSTSDVLTNYITNGDNFNMLEDGTLQGWNPYVGGEDESIKKLELVTSPELAPGKPLAVLANLAEIEGFLKVQYNGALTQDYKNAIYNSGFENNISFIDSVAKGQKFVFRWRAKSGDVDSETLTPVKNLRILVAKYTQDTPTLYHHYYKHIDANNIILQFSAIEEPKILNNIVENGYIDWETNSYYIDGVAQTVSTKYVYKDSTYVLTTDSTVVEGKDYYIRSGSGTEENPYTYTKVNTPIGNPSSEGWYENMYVWDSEQKCFVSLNSDNYLPYYYLVAEAQKTVPNSVLSDPSQRYGIFVYAIDSEQISIHNTYSSTHKTVNEAISPVLGTTISVNYKNSAVDYTYTFTAGTTDTHYEHCDYNSTDNTILIEDNRGIQEYTITYTGFGPFFIQDIQLTRFIADGADASGETPILIGNVPTATSKLNECYYLKPSNNAIKEEIKTYATLEALQNDLNIQESIVPIYNEDSEKILSISASQSNCFNILQTIAETFECWVELDVEHDEKGYILYDENNLPKKYINLKEYIGNDNYAGFKYGINLQSIERTINSEEIVTKLIVDQSQSDYVDEGFVSITEAPSNISGESYILNFDYYYNQGLLDRELAEKDRLDFITKIANINTQLKEAEEKRRNYSKSYTALSSDRNVYTELVETARENQTLALSDFKSLTGTSYEEYQRTESTIPDSQKLSEDDTILDILGEIYVNSAVINNYSGLLSNVEQEYQAVKKQLYGLDNYNVKIWVDKDALNVRHVYVELNDYLPGFSFVISGSPYESTVSKKFFDIETDAINVGSTPPENYLINDSEHYTYTINDEVVARFKITSVNTVAGVVDIIDDLLEEKNKLLKAFNNKYYGFIQEGTWSSTEYIDSELYYLDALQISNTSAQPTISYTINVVEISQLEGLEWYNFNTGDKTYIEDTEFFGWVKKNGVLTPVQEEVIVSEVEWHLEEPDQNQIVVQNYKTRFEDLFQRINATVQTVQYNEATYAKISSLLDSNGTINQDVLLDSLNNLSGKEYTLTSNGSIVINDDNILIQNLTNPANCVMINSEGIRVSSDGGETWATAINGQGIDIGLVYTGSLNTNEVIIGNSESPSFRWDKNGINAYSIKNVLTDNAETEEVYDLQTYVRFDRFGLYGIKNSESFKPQTIEDIEEKAHFAITWDGFFIKNNYPGGGRVEITSDNDFRVLNKVNNLEREKIKIGALEWIIPTEDISIESGKTYYQLINNEYVVVDNPVIENIESYYEKTTEPQGNAVPSLYGIRIKNNDGVEVMKTDDNGDLTIIGTIEATAANFSQKMTVGKNNDSVSNWITIDGRYSDIHSSDYFVDEDAAIRVESGRGWIINKNGDAVFNNITARGAIKTAVFEYAEIQAVGGIFIFRPSSTIRSAIVAPNEDDLILTVENPSLFAEGQWCKVSNYHPDTGEGQSIIENNGLTHIYEISDITNGAITLEGAAAMISGTDAVIGSANDLIGGALVDMGNKTNNGSNYGIGINSSDNTIDLPARAISLFETVIDETHEPKVTYNYQGILGTLPPMSAGVDASIYQYMQNKQGIYTDSMYIGDANQYLAFYEGANNQKKLKIKANQITFESPNSSPGSTEWSDITDTSYSIEIKVTMINYVSNEATLTAIPFFQGSTNIPLGVALNYTWYKDSVSSENIVGSSNVLSVTPAMGLNHCYICVISKN